MFKKLMKYLVVTCMSLVICFTINGLSTAKENKINATSQPQLIKVNKGQSTVLFQKYQALDLLSAQEAESDSDKALKIDYGFKVNADEVKNYHNSLDENALNIIGEEQADGRSSSKRFLEFHFSFDVRGQYYDEEYNIWRNDIELLWNSIYTTYSYYDKSNEYYTADDFNQWSQTTPKYDFISFSKNNKDVEFKINTTIANLTKYVKEEHPSYSNIKILDISMYISISYDSQKSFDSGLIESNYVSATDIHFREAGLNTRAWRLTLDKQLKILDDIQHIEDEDYKLTQSDFLSPVNVKYSYHCLFENRGPYYYQDEEGNYCDELYGFAPDDFEGNFFTEVNPHNQKTYGFSECELEKTSNEIKLREFVTSQNYALVMSMIGLKPAGAGGTSRVVLGCEVEFTYADGKVLVIPVRFDHEMAHLVAPCIHACSNCGECTAEEMLECNSEMYYGGADGLRMSECKCGQNNAIKITPVFNGTTEVNDTTYDVNVNELSTENDSKGTYLEILENLTPNLDIQTVYQVDVTSQGGYQEPFNGNYSNQVATVTFTVSEEVGQGLLNDTLGVIHVNTQDALGEEFVKETPENSGQHGTYNIVYSDSVYTLSITSKSYSPILIVNLEHHHDYSGEWQKDENHHWHVCECGKIEYKFDHVYDNDSDTTCNDCGYTREVSSPVIPDNPHTHVFDKWSSNENNHYKECTCGEKSEVGPHEYSDDSDDTCNVCGYKRSINQPTPTPTPTPTPKPKEKDSNNGAVVGIVVGSIAIVAVGGFGVYWFIFKKKH